MIPILFSENATSFDTWGIGSLTDALSCVVTEERNGLYECTLTYPADGVHFNEIRHSRIILAKPSDGKDPQPFRIYRISKPIGGIIEVNAEHISYQLSHIPTTQFYATSVSGALVEMKASAVVTCPFTFWTNKTDTGTIIVKEPTSMRTTMMGSGEDTILSMYGGEWEFDGYACKLWASRGVDNGVEITYGKNLTDLKQDESIANTITGIYPYWAKDGRVVDLPEKVVMSGAASSYPYPRVVTVDFSGEYQDEPSEEGLRMAAEEYIENNHIGIPDVAINVSFAPLWQSEEYSDVQTAIYERVRLCDYVTVRFPALGVSTKQQVTRTKYNTLTERYDEITVGDKDMNIIPPSWFNINMRRSV